jgi:hypothetical protein
MNEGRMAFDTTIMRDIGMYYFYRCMDLLQTLPHRKHCANKVHRLRRSLKMTHGKGKEFKKLPAVPTENLKDGQ